MATATELLFAEELAQLRTVAEDQGWVVQEHGPLCFLLGIPANDGSWLWLTCTCDHYSTLPPIWRWCDANGQNEDAPAHTAHGGAFFHTAGVICAPWNRLAYRAIDGRGPHPEWVPGDWKANPYTGQCTTLTAMASRIAVEARLRFTRRAA